VRQSGEQRIVVLRSFILACYRNRQGIIAARFWVALRLSSPVLYTGEVSEVVLLVKTDLF